MSNSLTAPNRRERIIASPRARRAHSRRNFGAEALRDVRGSGPNGRIVEADVLRFSPPAAPPLAEVALPSVPLIAPETGVVPYLYLRAEVDATELLHFILKTADYARKSDLRFGVSDVILWAFCTALREYPYVWPDGEGAPSPGDVTVAGTDHVVSRIIRGATKLGLPALARHRAGAANTPETLGAATAPVSFFDAISSGADEVSVPLAAGQTLAVSISALKSRPFVVEGELAVRLTLRLCLSADSRVVNATTAARFLAVLVELLQEPEAMAVRGV